MNNFFLPFVKKYRSKILNSMDKKDKCLYIFFEGIPNEDLPILTNKSDRSELGIGSDFVYAPHWYDLNIAFSKQFDGFLSHNVQQLSRVTNIDILVNFEGFTKYHQTFFFWF